MGRAVRVNVDGLKELKQNLVEQQKQVDTYMRLLASDIAALLLRKVKKRTPVGEYDNDIETYKRDNKKKGIKAGDFKVDKKGNYKRKGYKSVTFKKDGKEQTKLYYRRGGTLRGAWTVGEISKVGDKYSIEVFNPIEYASYVEYGHRQEPGKFVPVLGKKLKKAWVPGRFMLTISENEIRDNLESIIQKRLKVILERMKNA